MPKKAVEPQQYRVAYHYASGLAGVAFVNAGDEAGAREGFKAQHPGAIIDLCCTEKDREFQPINPVVLKLEEP